MSESIAVAERWLEIPDYGGAYEVSDQGRVRSVDRVVHCRNGRSLRLSGRILVQNSTSDGRLAVYLRRDNETDTKRVHTLVLAAFVGPRPAGMECCHENGVPTDNRLVNLAWDTHARNIADKIRHGTDHQRNKSQCPRQHRLAAPNLVRHIAAKGYRSCLACARARANEQKAEADGREFDFYVAADEHYRRIMMCT